MNLKNPNIELNVIFFKWILMINRNINFKMKSNFINFCLSNKFKFKKSNIYFMVKS